MHIFTQKSLEIVNQFGYLDKLSQIYKFGQNSIRPLEEHIWENIVKSFESIDQYNLIFNSLKSEKSPINDPFTYFLKLNPENISQNPETTKRLSKKLLDLCLKHFKHTFEIPIENSRQIGPMFSNWLKTEFAFTNIL